MQIALQIFAVYWGSLPIFVNFAVLVFSFGSYKGYCSTLFQFFVTFLNFLCFSTYNTLILKNRALVPFIDTSNFSLTILFLITNYKLQINYNWDIVVCQSCVSDNLTKLRDHFKILKIQNIMAITLRLTGCVLCLFYGYTIIEDLGLICQKDLNLATGYFKYEKFSILGRTANFFICFLVTDLWIGRVADPLPWRPFAIGGYKGNNQVLFA